MHHFDIHNPICLFNVFQKLCLNLPINTQNHQRLAGSANRASVSDQRRNTHVIDIDTMGAQYYTDLANHPRSVIVVTNKQVPLWDKRRGESI